MRPKSLITALVGLLLGAFFLSGTPLHAGIVVPGGGGGGGGGSSSGTAIQKGDGSGGFAATTCTTDGSGLCQAPLTADGTPSGEYLDAANNLAGIAAVGVPATARANLGLGTVATSANPVAGSITGTAWAPLYTSYNDTITTLVNNSSTATIEATADVFPYWHNYSGALGASLTAVLPTNGGVYNNVIAFHVTQPSGSHNYVFNTPTTSAAGGIVGPSCGQLGTATGSKYDVAYAWDDGDSSWNTKCVLTGIAFVDTATLTDTTPTCSYQTSSAGCAASGLTGCTEVNRISLPSNGDCFGALTLVPPLSSTIENSEQLQIVVTGTATVFPSSIAWSAGSSGVSFRSWLTGSTLGSMGTSPLCATPPTNSNTGIWGDVSNYNSGNSRLTETLCGSYPPPSSFPITAGGTASKKGVPYVWNGTTASIASTVKDFIGFGENANEALITSEDNALSSWPVGSVAANAYNLLCWVTTTPTGTGDVFTLRKNKADTALTCTVAASQTIHNGRYWCSDVTDTVTIGFTAGATGSSYSDLVDVDLLADSVAATGVAGCSLQIAG